MSLLRKLRELVNPKPKAPQTQAPLRRLRSLSTEQLQDLFVVIDDLSTQYGEAILSSSDTTTIHYYRGAVAALRKLGILIHDNLKGG